ncbi:sex comb on midleg-like protein 1 [Rhynchocyon petersi]
MLVIYGAIQDLDKKFDVIHGKVSKIHRLRVKSMWSNRDIDGKALLLLRSDIMMTYMGLKLGTAVKLCHYIERLKQKTGLHY